MPINFECPSLLRHFRIECADGRTLFVNAPFLAELSPYFLALLNDANHTFVECRQRCVHFVDVPSTDLAILLSSVCPDEQFHAPRAIIGANFAPLVNLSSRLIFPQLRIQLEHFAVNATNFHGLSPEQLMENIVEMFASEFGEHLLLQQCRLLAECPSERIAELLRALPDHRLALRIERMLRPMLARAKITKWDYSNARLFF